MAVPLHVQEKNVGPAVSIHIGEGRVAAPAVRVQSYLGGDVLEVVVPHVLVKHGILIALCVQVPVESVRYTNIFAVRPLIIGGVLAHIAHQEVNQAVVVIVEKERTRGMCGEAAA